MLAGEQDAGAGVSDFYAESLKADSRISAKNSRGDPRNRTGDPMGIVRVTRLGSRDPLKQQVIGSALIHGPRSCELLLGRRSVQRLHQGPDRGCRSKVL